MVERSPGPKILPDCDRLTHSLPQPSSNSKRRRRRRQDDETIDDDDNGFVTTCEGRFIQLDDSTKYVLVWACPENVAPPTAESGEETCQIIVAVQDSADSCKSQTGVIFTKEDDDVPDTE